MSQQNRDVSSTNGGFPGDHAERDAKQMQQQQQHHALHYYGRQHYPASQSPVPQQQPAAAMPTAPLDLIDTSPLGVPSLVQRHSFSMQYTSTSSPAATAAATETSSAIAGNTATTSTNTYNSSGAVNAVNSSPTPAVPGAAGAAVGVGVANSCPQTANRRSEDAVFGLPVVLPAGGGSGGTHAVDVQRQYQGQQQQQQQQHSPPSPALHLSQPAFRRPGSYLDPHAFSHSASTTNPHILSNNNTSMVGSEVMALSPTRAIRYPYWNIQPRYNSPFVGSYMGFGNSSPGAVSLSNITTPTMLQQQQRSPQVAPGFDGARSFTARDPSYTNNNSFLRENSLVAYTPSAASPTSFPYNYHHGNSNYNGSVGAVSINASANRMFRDPPPQLPLVPPDNRTAPSMTVGDCILESSPYPLPGLAEESPVMGQLSPSSDAANGGLTRGEDYLTEVAEQANASGVQSSQTCNSSSQNNSAYYQPLRPPFHVEGRSHMPSPGTPPPSQSTPMEETVLPLVEAPAAASHTAATAADSSSCSPGDGVAGSQRRCKRASDSQNTQFTTTDLTSCDEVPNTLDHTARPRHRASDDSTADAAVRDDAKERLNAGEVNEGDERGATSDDGAAASHPNPPTEEEEEVEAAVVVVVDTTNAAHGPLGQDNDHSATPPPVERPTSDTATTAPCSRLAPAHLRETRSGSVEGADHDTRSSTAQTPVVATPEEASATSPFVLMVQDREQQQQQQQQHCVTQSPAALSISSEPGLALNSPRHFLGNRTSSCNSVSNIFVPPRPDPLSRQDISHAYADALMYAAGCGDPRTPANVRNRSAVIHSLGDPSLASNGSPLPQGYYYGSTNFLPPTTTVLTVQDAAAIALRHRSTACALEEMEDLAEVVRLLKSDLGNLLHPIPSYLYGLQASTTDALASLVALQDQLCTTIIASKAAVSTLGLSAPLWHALREKCTAVSREVLAPIADEALTIAKAAKTMSARKRIIAAWTVEALQEVLTPLVEIAEYAAANAARSRDTTQATVPPVTVFRATPPPAAQPTQNSPNVVVEEATHHHPQNIAKGAGSHCGSGLPSKRVSPATLTIPNAAADPTQGHQRRNSFSTPSMNADDDRKRAVARAADMNVKELCEYLSGDRQLKVALDKEFPTFVKHCQRKTVRVALLGHLVADSVDLSRGSDDDDYDDDGKSSLSSSSTHDPDSAAQSSSDTDNNSPNAHLRTAADSVDPVTAGGANEEGNRGNPRTASHGAEAEGKRKGSHHRQGNSTKEGSLTPPDAPGIDTAREAEKSALLESCVDKLFAYIAGKLDNGGPRLFQPQQQRDLRDHYMINLPLHIDVVKHFSDMEDSAAWSWWYGWHMATQLSPERRGSSMDRLHHHVKNFLRESEQGRRLRTIAREDARGRSTGGAMWLGDQLGHAEGELGRLEQRYMSRTRHILQLMLRRIVLLSCNEEAPFTTKQSPPQSQLNSAPHMPVSGAAAVAGAGSSNSNANPATEAAMSPTPQPPLAPASVLTKRLCTHYDSVRMAKEELDELATVADKDVRNLRAFADKWRSSGAESVGGINVNALQRRVLLLKNGCNNATCTYCKGAGLYATQEDNVAVVSTALDAIANAGELLLCVLRRGTRKSCNGSPADSSIANGSATGGGAGGRGVGSGRTPGSVPGTMSSIPITLLARRTHSQQTNAFVDEDEDGNSSEEGEAFMRAFNGARVSHSTRNTPVSQQPSPRQLATFATTTNTATNNRNSDGTRWSPRSRNGTLNSLEEQQLLNGSSTGGAKINGGRAGSAQKNPKRRGSVDKNSSGDLFVPKPSTRALNRLQMSLGDLAVSLEKNFAVLFL